VSWLPFFLRPQMPKEGHAKGGTPSDRVGNWLRSLNAKEGPEINFTGKCDRYPNTELYHVALEHVQAKYGAGVQHQMASRLFKGYYQDGIYPDEANLLALGLEVEPTLDISALQADLRDPEKVEKVFNYAQQLARQLRVTGVPYFIINGTPAFSGAQEENVFLSAFASAEESAAAPTA